MPALVPPLSVVVPTRNRPAMVKRCVESILANSFEEFELIVVDQSTDRQAQGLLQGIEDPRLRYVPTMTKGAAVCRNIGIRETRSSIIVFTDDDTICDREWLASIWAEFQGDPEVMAVYGRAVPFGHQEGRICPCINESTERLVLHGPAVPSEVLGGGNNMAFRREVFETLGLFIETLGPGTRIGHGEDTEFSYRVLRNNCKVVYTPVPVVEHDKWVNPGELAHLMKGAMRGIGLVFLTYALRYDRFAFDYVLRMGYRLLRNRLAIGSAAIGVWYFAQGLALAPYYRFVRPPPFRLKRLFGEASEIQKARATGGAMLTGRVNPQQ